MKVLVKVGENAWVNPDQVVGIVGMVRSTLVMLENGQNIEVHGVSDEDVIDALELALPYGEEGKP